MLEHYVPDFEVKIQGLTMEADVKNAVISLSYDNNLDQADMFQLTLNNADLRLTDSALFDVGKQVEIHMGYVGNLRPMMLGEIVAVEPSFPAGGAPTLAISGYDKSHRMRHNKKTRAFQYTNASLIAAQIAAENLLIPLVDPVPVPIEFMTQNGSDMMLLKKLARRLFFETYVHWDRLFFRLPRPQIQAVVLEWGKNLSSFNPRLSTSGQVGQVAIQGYDSKLAQTIVSLIPVVATDFDVNNIIERLGSGFIDRLTDFGTKCLSEETVNSFPDAISLAKAILGEILEGLYEGRGACIGLPELRAGEMIDIQGVGKKYSGKYRLRKVTHTIDDGGYQTTFEVTQRSSSSMLQLFRRFINDEEPPNKPKKMDGPVEGKVINNIDPEGLGRVQVQYPWLCGKMISTWVKVIQPDVNTYVMPNIGDNVMVSFLKGNFDQPVLTGTFWNVKARPPKDGPSPTNFKKVFQSGKGHKIILDDTPGSGGISLESAKGTKIVIDANDNITIAANGNVTINKGEKGAARKDDEVEVTIPAGKFLTKADNGVLNEEVKVTGKIISSSATVKIGN